MAPQYQHAAPSFTVVPVGCHVPCWTVQGWARRDLMSTSLGVYCLMRPCAQRCIGLNMRAPGRITDRSFAWQLQLFCLRKQMPLTTPDCSRRVYLPIQDRGAVCIIILQLGMRVKLPRKRARIFQSLMCHHLK